MNKDRPKNKAIIYWDNPSYTAVDASELKTLPEEVKHLLVNTLLEDLNIGVRVR